MTDCDVATTSNCTGQEQRRCWKDALRDANEALGSFVLTGDLPAQSVGLRELTRVSWHAFKYVQLDMMLELAVGGFTILQLVVMCAIGGLRAARMFAMADIVLSAVDLLIEARVVSLVLSGDSAAHAERLNEARCFNTLEGYSSTIAVVDNLEGGLAAESNPRQDLSVILLSSSCHRWSTAHPCGRATPSARSLGPAPPRANAASPTLTP